MIRFLLLLYLALLVPLLSSCGYHLGDTSSLSPYTTLAIPYAEGDEEGIFTTQLIRTLQKKGKLMYRSTGAELLLQVSLRHPVDTNIGFIYARGEDKNHILVSNEARISLVACFTLLNCRTGECVMGPFSVETSFDYDFEPDMSHVNYHAFALGQLEMQGLAREVATPSLYTLLAEKIVDYINHSW